MNPGSILYVDPDVTRQERVVVALENHLADVVVETTTSVTTALERVADRSVDCLVSRYELAESDGIELLRHTRDNAADLPFVLVTDQGSEALASEAIAADVTEYVPVNGDDELDRLVSRVKSAIDEDRSQTVYRDIFELLDDAIVIHDPETGDAVDVNQAVCEQFGYSYNEACECNASDLSACSQPTSDRSAQEWIRHTLEEGPQHTEWVCETGDGKKFWADVQLKPLSTGTSDRVVALIRDITNRKFREQELASFRQAVEHAGHSIYSTDTDGEIRYVNPAFESITGYTTEEAIGQTPNILKSGEHDREFYQDLWSTILAGEVWQRELINEHKDGHTYAINQTIAPITDETGDIVRFVAVNADISEQRRRERQLQELYEATTDWLDAKSRQDVCEIVSDHLTNLLEFDLHGLYLYDETTHRLEPATVSTEATTKFDVLPTFEAGEAIAWEVYESGAPKMYDDVSNDPDAYNPSTNIRSELLHPLGEHGVLMIGSERIEAFTATDKTFAKILASMLTEVLTRIERECDLQEQNSRLEEFATVVSHDLRNPLSIASGHLELARETGEDAHLDEIEYAHDRITRIIEDLLWLAHEGRGIGETRPIDLEHIASAAWAHVDTAEATLKIDWDGRFEADSDRLQQLFENLFRNAVEHGGHDVTVSVGRLEDGFFLEDDGPGIPAPKRDEILKTGYTTSSDGTGYGLSIVQTIIEAHGWSLEVCNSQDGGARFEVHGVLS
ncbi:PAS domain S-box protein [Natronolimnobius sp. AArcel1]|uniref:hybrid sensor histidine kinase/response regulator n=1 Tax=Natronolimnobius sp. AArcel1 TaxID=1679093 RepID=UPI0019CF7AF8